MLVLVPNGHEVWSLCLCEKDLSLGVDYKICGAVVDPCLTQQGLVLDVSGDTCRLQVGGSVFEFRASQLRPSPPSTGSQVRVVGGQYTGRRGSVFSLAEQSNEAVVEFDGADVMSHVAISISLLTKYQP